MLSIDPPDYKFCPFCRGKLQFKIEDGRKKKCCDSCGWTYYPHVAGAVAAVIIKDGKTLMVKRAREPYRNTWMFPAGFIDYGEHPLDALRREVKEETGLRVKKASLLEIIQTEDDPRSPGHFCFFYEVIASGNKIKTDEKENKEIAWFDIKKPLRIGWKSHKYILSLLQKRQANFLRR